jgi:hypothetical protein
METESKMSGFTLPKQATPEELDTQALEAAKLAEGLDSKPLTYLDKIKAYDLTLEQALQIIDSLVTEGAWEEDIQLSKSVKIRFKTRSAKFNSYLAETIDISDPKKVGKLNHMMALNQVAASLEQYGPAKMPPLDDDMPKDLWEANLKQRIAFVSKLPSPVFLIMNSKLSIFDQKLLIIFSEGYEKNF